MESVHIIINLLNKHHFYENENNRKRILSANKILYDYAKELKAGMPFYNSAIAVATEIASKRFNCDTVLAALFHNTPYEELESNNYTDFYSFQNILDTYKRLDLELKELYCRNKGVNFNIPEPIANLDPQALAIRIAVQKDIIRNTNSRIDDLSYMTDFTKKILVPILRKVKAYKDEDELLELCLKVEKPIIYQDIKSHLEKYRKSQKDTIGNTLMRLKHLFDPNNKMIPDSLKKYQVHVKEFRSDPRKIYSIYRSLEKKYNTDDFCYLLKNDNTIAFYNCTIILKDFKISESQKKLFYADLFFAYYRDILCKDNIYVLDYGLTTHKDASFFTICDEANNKYRIFIKNETEYFEYIYGNILEKHNIDFLPAKYEHIINVYKKDGTIEPIIAGATVLDLAFKIHGDLGLHFDYAIRNNKSIHEGPYTVLARGDIVEIKQKKHITANLNWFKYVKTDVAKYHLTRYFKTEYSRLYRDKKIKITSKDGTTYTLPHEVTALDFAFSIHRELGLHFSYALINNQKKHMPAYARLNDGDNVVICTNNYCLPDLHWFQYVKTEASTKYLVKYFLKKQELYKKNCYIEILTDDKKLLLIEKDATVLDFAFMLNPHLGRCFSHAKINNDGILYGPDTVLKNKDYVIIHASSKHTIKKEWIHFVKTSLAKAEISNYLKIGFSLI